MTIYATGPHGPLSGFIRAVQYLAALPPESDLHLEVAKAMRSFFHADIAVVEEQDAHGQIVARASQGEGGCKDVVEATLGPAAQVFDSGFMASEQVHASGPCAAVLLPITVLNQVSAVLLVGHRASQIPPRETLEAYLAVANLVGTLSEKRLAERRLTNSERQLRLVLETIPAGIALVDGACRYRFVNAEAEQILGARREEIIGRRCCGPQLMRSPSGEPCPDEEQPCALALRRDEPIYGAEYQLWQPEKGRVVLSINAVRLPASEGGVALSFQDVTESRRAEQALRKAKELAEAADRAKSEFLDIAAHEMRGPLNPLRVLVQHGLRRLDQGLPVERGSLQRMLRQADRLADMVEHLLDTSRAQRGALAFNPVRLDLRPLVAEMVEDFRRQVPERTISYAQPERPAVSEVDPKRIEEVVANLLDNALKYSPQGSPVEVEVALLPRGTVRVSVTDHGPGIPLADQQRLFTRFYRVSSKTTLRQPGLGLGLYLCRKIVEWHGGKIECLSTPGEGCTFAFTLPAPGRGRGIEAERDQSFRSSLGDLRLGAGPVGPD